MNEIEDDKEKSIRFFCKKCGSKFVYYRIKNKEIVCRQCGFISKINDNIKENEKEEN